GGRPHFLHDDPLTGFHRLLQAGQWNGQVSYPRRPGGWRLRIMHTEHNLEEWPYTSKRGLFIAGSFLAEPRARVSSHRYKQKRNRRSADRVHRVSFDQTTWTRSASAHRRLVPDESPRQSLRG